MADKKISELGSIAASVADDDLYVVVDDSTNTTKNFNHRSLKNVIGAHFSSRSAAVTEWAAMVSRSETPPVGTVWTWPNGSIVYDGSTDISDLSGWRLSGAQEPIAELGNGFNLIAHRGFMSCNQQNTLMAFSRASRVTPHWETDISFSSDGTAYIFHDTTIDALTDGTGTFTALTDAYIDARKFDGLSGTALHDYVKIAKFADFLSLASEHRAFIWPEMKNLRSTADIETVVDMVADAGMLNRCVLSSFSMDQVLHALDYNPEVSVYYLTGSSTLATLQGYLDQLAEYPRRSGLLNLYTSVSTTPDQIAYANARGLEIGVWTINDDVNINTMLALGVTNIVSDAPIGGYRNAI